MQFKDGIPSEIKNDARIIKIGIVLNNAGKSEFKYEVDCELNPPY